MPFQFPLDKIICEEKLATLRRVVELNLQVN